MDSLDVPQMNKHYKAIIHRTDFTLLKYDYFNYLTLLNSNCSLNMLIK